MTRFNLVFLILICCVGLGFAKDSETDSVTQVKQKVAIYISGDMHAKQTTIIESKMVEYITKSKNYVAIERTESFLKILRREHDYQRSGSVRDDQIARVGKQLGVRFVISAEIVMINGEIFAAARMIDVEDGTIVRSADASKSSVNIKNLKSLAEDLAASLLDVSKLGTLKSKFKRLF